MRPFRQAGSGSVHPETRQQHELDDPTSAAAKRRRLDLATYTSGDGSASRTPQLEPGPSAAAAANCSCGYPDCDQCGADWEMEVEDNGVEDPFPSDDSPHDQRNWCASQVKRFKKLKNTAGTDRERAAYGDTMKKYEHLAQELWAKHKGMSVVRPSRDGFSESSSRALPLPTSSSSSNHPSLMSWGLSIPNPPLSWPSRADHARPSLGRPPEPASSSSWPPTPDSLSTAAAALVPPLTEAGATTTKPAERVEYPVVPKVLLAASTADNSGSKYSLRFVEVLL